MSNIEIIISSFSTDEQQKFIIFLEKKNKRKDTKNVDLFKLILKGETSTKIICETLYGSLKKDAYYTLKQRLYNSLIDFIAANKLQGENSTDIQLVKYILVARDFFMHKNYKAAYKILDKAELVAREFQLFTILTEIYHTKIQYAYTIPTININEIIDSFKENQKNQLLQEELNIVYAKIRQNLKKVNQKNGNLLDFQTITSSIFKEHNISINDSMSFKSLYQLITIVSISAFATKDFISVESFLISTYKKLENKKENNKQLFYHIRILYLIANTLFRNKNFEKSIYYLNLMHTYMLLNKKKYYNNFKFNYLLLFALNKNYTNNQSEAIQILENVITKKNIETKTALDVHLSLIMFYFQNNQLKKASQLFSKFYHSDKWYIDKNGIEWTIKKNLIEILLHLELRKIDVFESRLLSFKRKHYTYLKNIQQFRVINFLKLVEVYYKNPQIITTKDFFNKVESSFEFIGAKQEDIFVMSFYAWLKSKMNQQPIFISTLNLIEQIKLE
ncbi:hypothetical protein SAMN04487765_2477 [Tenacibaculum sp. MAR_2010_89]|uniref:hypothetical protein n=1 Tax=Tenacibaculum sp. MAR_2010_89 TaxID=1250198 RepID=UPI0008969013|nr:hypothetical protein [Tenacibaculum sp. MAR_2010_89]SEE41425.1 hypothetical protein SAMN04487765_2477 [Tenacibaculum sp. MAR_2010_89]